MKKIILLTVLCFSAQLFQPLSGQKQLPVNDSLGFEVLLTDGMSGKIGLKGSFINSLEITPERLILLSTGDQYYLLGWGGIIPHGRKISGKINSFALTGDGLLLTIVENKLCYFDSMGNLAVMYTLPATGMTISAGKDVMYLFDSNLEHKTHPLYVLARGGKYLKLIETPAPITSVVETDNYVLFASGANIYSINVEKKDVKLLYTDEEGKEIKSLAYDSSGKSVYFSTASSVSAIRGSDIIVISENTGGILKYYNGLIVFNPGIKMMLRIVGLDGTLPVKPYAESRAAPRPEPQEVSKTELPTAPRTEPAQATSRNELPAAPRPEPAQAASLNELPTAPRTEPAQATSRNELPAAPRTEVIFQSGKQDIEAVTVLTNATVADLVRNNLSDYLIKDIIRRSRVEFILTSDAVIELSGKGVSSEVILEMREAMKRQSADRQIK
ncbi:MAG: hypothetical protein RBT02_01470 [Bacteroidales bacterium]|jgi:hypothetical protein|nr:hypothetical protein [Bacteroidales bacterium]